MHKKIRRAGLNKEMSILYWIFIGSGSRCVQLIIPNRPTCRPDSGIQSLVIDEFLSTCRNCNQLIIALMATKILLKFTFGFLSKLLTWAYTILMKLWSFIPVIHWKESSIIKQMNKQFCYFKSHWICFWIN